MASSHLKLLAVSLGAVLVAAAPARAQSFATAENAPALLREPWVRSATRFERRWQFLGPLTADEAAAAPAGLLAADSPAAKRWAGLAAYTDAVEVAVPHTSFDPEPAGSGVFALGRATVPRDRDGDALLLLGADGGLEVFVNGTSVYRRPEPRPFSFDQDVVPVTLKRGDNTIVLRLEHHEGPWRVSLRAVEPGTAAKPREEITPSLIGADTRQLAVQTNRERAISLGLVSVEVVAPGGTIVARGTGTRGDVLRFATTAWEDGPYEVRCSTDDAWGRRRYVHLPWYKGDAAAAARALVAAAAQEPPGPAGDTVRLLVDLVQDRSAGKLDAAGPELWRDIFLPLLEYRELLLTRAGKTGGERASGFVRLAYTDEVDGSTQYCRAYLPPGYDAAKRWPLVIFLHGFNPPNPPYLHWWSVDQRHSAEADNGPAIVLEPHGRGNAMYRGIGEKDVLRALAEAKQRFAVDDDRVYLTGESMGGHGVWWIASRHPDLFAAAAPVHGGWDLRQTPVARGGLAGYAPTNDAQQWLLELQSSFISAENLRHLPIFVHHGDADPAVSVENSRYAVHLLERWGYDVGYEEHVGFGHEDLLARGRIVDWLLTHRRVAAPATVRLRAGDLGGASAYWLKVEAWSRPARVMEVDAEFIRPGLLRLDTQNVAAVTLTPPDSLAAVGDELTVVWNGKARTMTVKPRPAIYLEAEDVPAGVIKHRGLEGSVSDVITTPFIVVVGTSSPDAAMREMCRQKAEAFAANWNTWQKHRPRLRPDAELTADERKNFSLILIGGPDANSVTQELAAGLPLKVEPASVAIDGRSWPVTDAVVQLVYPSPLAPERYVLVVAGTSATGLYFWRPELWHHQAGAPTVPWDWTIQDGRQVALPPGSPTEEGFVAAGILDRSWRRDDRTTVTGNEELRARSPLRRGPLAAEAAGKIALKPFVGRYEIAPGVVATVTEQDGRLVLQPPGQPAVALWPESDADFGAPAGTGSVHFAVDADQKVTALVAFDDGREYTFERLADQP